MFSVTVYKYAVLQVSCVLLKGLVVCTLNSSSFTILHFYVPAGRLLRLLFPRCTSERVSITVGSNFGARFM